MTNPRKFNRLVTAPRDMTGLNAAIYKSCDYACHEAAGADVRAGDVLVVRYKFTGYRLLYVQRVGSGPATKLRLHVEGADNVPLYWPVIDVGRYERVLLLVKPDDVERS